MPLRRRSGGPPQTPATDSPVAAKTPVNADRSLSDGHSNPLERAIADVPEVVGFAYAPGGRRHLWALLVPVCAHCGLGHLHRGAGPDGGLRVASCGKPYRVRVAGSKRRRWSR